jgi:hypothetical protein
MSIVLYYKTTYQIDQTAEVRYSDICGGVVEHFNGTVTLLSVTGRVYFVFEKYTCQLAVINIAHVSSVNSCLSRLMKERKHT